MPKLKTWLFLAILVASAAKVVSDVTALTHEYLMPTHVEKTSDVTMQSLTLIAGSLVYSSMAQSPNGIETQSTVSGTVSLCCVDHESNYFPYLFILTSDQATAWRDRSNDPTEYVAETSITPPYNYTFSGPNRTETLTFRIIANTPGVYYFVVISPLYEKATLHLDVLSPNVTESPMVEWLFIIAAVGGLVGLAVSYGTDKD